MDKTITISLTERNFITSALSLLARDKRVDLNQLQIFDYSERDILKLVNKILNQDYS